MAKPLPGVAQVAMQQGPLCGKANSTAASLVVRLLAHLAIFDKGSMAVVGKGFAVLQSGKVQISGLGAWLTWAAPRPPYHPHPPNFLGHVEPSLGSLLAVGLDLCDGGRGVIG